MKLTQHILIAALMTTAACVKPGDLANLAPQNPYDSAKPDTFPEITAQSATGTLFGNPWTVKFAGARKTRQGETSITMVTDDTDVCSPNAMSGRPYATVVVPELKENGEYITNAAINQYVAPVVMIDMTASPPLNLLSEKSKIRVSKITPGGFDLALYAMAKDQNNRVNEISGHVNVIDCESQVTWSIWRSFEAYYYLTSFDGTNFPWDQQMTSPVVLDTTRFQDLDGTYIPVVRFPLYTSVSPTSGGGGSSMSLSFGPLYGKGTSYQTTQGQQTTYVYDFNGPLLFRGSKITLNLHMEVLKNPDSTLKVSYTVDVPGMVNKTSHVFTLRK